MMNDSRQFAAPGEVLWQPGAASREANVLSFQRWLRATRGISTDSYASLWQWSVSDIAAFWSAVWDYFGLPAEGSFPVLTSRAMPGARWFPGARLNFAEHVLAAGNPADIAVFYRSENGEAADLSRAALRDGVARLAAALRARGVRPGDRVAGYLPATPHAVIAFLAAASIGAVWSCCAAEFGPASVLDRFSQIAPKVLIAADGYRHGGKAVSRAGQAREIAAGLPSVECLIWIGRLSPEPLPLTGAPDVVGWDALMSGNAPGAEASRPAVLPFDHPLWIVYSSGTTGPPKAIVHGHGGVLLELLKLNHFHLDLKPSSRVFFYTTTGWIVFPVLVSALLTGCGIVLYDGSPAYPGPGALWSVASGCAVTHFGTSPGFVSVLARAGYVPARAVPLGSLECVICTGSPLTADSYGWIYRNVKADLWVTSICGGTDVVSALLGGVPTLPVTSGEIQARCLGADVQAFGADGRPVLDAEGELVVTQPIPSMPLYLWNDPGGRRYREAYFDRWPGVWRHGDRLRITGRGTCVVSGRSDATLNRHGVRIGTSEIYRIVEADEAVGDSLVVDVPLPGGGSRMVLFVVPAPGHQVDGDLRSRLARRLRSDGSPRHVPDLILQADAVPYTLTGKKMEVPVKRILAGHPVGSAAARAAMANPDALDQFTRIDLTAASTPMEGS